MFEGWQAVASLMMCCSIFTMVSGIRMILQERSQAESGPDVAVVDTVVVANSTAATVTTSAVSALSHQ